MTDSVSAVVPTIGRAENLAALLASLCDQTERPAEVIVADASDGDEVAKVIADRRWLTAGLAVPVFMVKNPDRWRG